MPTALREHESERRRRRYLTVLFADLSDSSGLATTLEAEQYAELLEDLRKLCRTIIPQHGGRIAQLLGDGVLAIFGYPEPHEGDGRRAVEAALELHEAVRRLHTRVGGGPAIALHTGVHCGLVLSGEGDPELGRFELLGSTPNIAARLADAARRDEIVVSADTLGPERYFFTTSQLERLSLKGFAAPIAAYRILARADVRTRFEASAVRGLAPLVGRDAELLAFDEQLRRPSNGLRFVALCAAPGLGKTRLAEEFLRRAQALGNQVHRGYCENSLSAEPLQPILQGLRKLFGVARDESPTRILDAVSAGLLQIDPDLMDRRDELAKALFGSHEAGRSAAERTGEAIVALFSRLAAQRPQVILIDDWQWADGATRQVIRALRALEPSPILVLAATRDQPGGDVDLRSAVIFELAPFSRQETAQIVDKLQPGADPFIVDEIYRYSGGNALFIEELCHSASRSVVNGRIEARQRSGAWLDALIDSRVARLPKAQRELLRTAAAIGNVVPRWLFEKLTAVDADHPLVRGLSAQDLMFPGDSAGVLRFKHGIARDVIYAAIGLHERRELHRRIAAALLERNAAGAPEEAYELLAYHYTAGEQPLEAARFAELAAAKAIAASALDIAKAQFRAALAALDKLEPSAEVQRRWMSIAQQFGLACVFDPSREDLEIFRRACELAHRVGDALTIARAEYWLGYFHYGLGDAADAVTHCERALQVGERIDDEPLRVQIVAALGQVHAAACDYDRAQTLLDAAIEVKRRHRTGTRPAVGLAYSLACKAQVLGDRGEFDAAEACFQEALAAIMGVDHEVEASIRGWRSAVLLWQGRWAEALESAQAAVRIGRQVRSLFSFSMSYAAGAYAGWMLEGRPDSLQAIENATAWLEPRRVRLFTSLNFGWLADGASTSNRYADTRRFAARAMRRARANDLLGVAMAYRALAHADLQRGEYGRASKHLERAQQVAQARKSRHEIAATHLHGARLAYARGERSVAQRRLEQSMVEFDRLNMPWHLQQAQQFHSEHFRRGVD